jgi:hypothetical protein
MTDKKMILHEVFLKIIFELDNGINSNIGEYITSYNQINKGHRETFDEIKKSFYQMAFCIEVRKTTKYSNLEREECNAWFDEFMTLRV